MSTCAGTSRYQTGSVPTLMQVHKGKLRLPQEQRRRQRPGQRSIDLRLSVAAVRRDDCTWRVGTRQDMLLGAPAALARQCNAKGAAPGVRRPPPVFAKGLWGCHRHIWLLLSTVHVECRCSREQWRRGGCHGRCHTKICQQGH